MSLVISDIPDMETLIKEGKNLHKKQLNMLVHELMYYYVNQGYVEAILTTISLNEELKASLFAFSDYILYELEEAQDKLKDPFKDIDDKMRDYCSLVATLELLSTPIERDDETDKKLILANAEAIAHKLAYQYLYAKFIDGENNEIEAFVDKLLPSQPFMDILEDENVNKIREGVINVIDACIRDLDRSK